MSTAPSPAWLATLRDALTQTLAALRSPLVREEHGFKAVAVALSVLFNAIFFVLLFRQDPKAGDARLLVPESMPIMLAAARPRAQAEAQSSEPATKELEQLDLDSSPAELVAPDIPEEGSAEPSPQPQERIAAADATPAAPPAPVTSSEQPVPQRRTEIEPTQKDALMQRVLNAVQALGAARQNEVAWYQDGQRYRATLTRDAASSMDLDNIRVDILTDDATGTQRKTQLTMQRLAFSQFTQMVDYWDVNVQLHDDVIVGRFHSNTPFTVADDSSAIPRFSGKVSTAARNLWFSGTSARRRQQMFAGGLETRAGRIELPSELQPFAGGTDPNAFTQTFSDDTHIMLRGDGTYSWRTRGSEVPQAGTYPQDRPTYFIGESGATLHVAGTVNGKVAAYSPERIVIEGNLIYAQDPRADGADDYLGLVSDRNVEIAPPSVTGRGDLTIHAAIFARRRFVVTNIEMKRTATLRIYGSLTVGTISATEPRYATHIEFDSRFDRVRPPGFPATNRYEIASWDAAWSEATVAPSQ